MFSSIGPLEILVIAGVALIVLGPEKFPTQAKMAMRMFRDAKGYWEDAKREFTEELKPVRKELNEIKKYKPEQYLDSITGEQEAPANGNGAASAAATPGEGTANAPVDDSGPINLEPDDVPVQFSTAEDSDTGVKHGGSAVHTEWNRQDDDYSAAAPETKDEDFVEKPERFDD